MWDGIARSRTSKKALDKASTVGPETFPACANNFARRLPLTTRLFHPVGVAKGSRGALLLEDFSERQPQLPSPRRRFCNRPVVGHGAQPVRPPPSSSISSTTPRRFFSSRVRARVARPGDNLVIEGLPRCSTVPVGGGGRAGLALRRGQALPSLSPAHADRNEHRQPKNRHGQETSLRPFFDLQL